MVVAMAIEQAHFVGAFDAVEGITVAENTG
jgi:hypothetical protein